MMIHCPRCGFAQPNDQYCAQCGVNMLAFKPRQKSFLKKLADNVAFQIIALVLVAVVAGTYLFRSTNSASFSKKTERIFSKTNYKTASQPIASIDTGSNKETFGELTNKSITIDDNSAQSLEATQPASSSLPQPLANAAAGAQSAALAKGDSEQTKTEPGAVMFKVRYLEVSREVLQRWINDSSSTGLFQNLQDYSAGILPDFNARGDKILQYLKTSEKILSPGQSEEQITGKTLDDRTTVMGLSVHYDFKSMDAGSVRGSVNIGRLGRQNRDVFPADFELRKGAVFFIVDILTPQSFPIERRDLTMAPFQIFKSPDFMTQNSKFVILIEPLLK